MKRSQAGSHLASSGASRRQERPRHDHAPSSRPVHTRPEAPERSEERRVPRERTSPALREPRQAPVPERPVPSIEGRGRKNAVRQRPLLVASYICLLIAFLFGASEFLQFREARPSESENRMLQGFPAFNAGTLVSGKFMEEMESYLSDTFYFRDQAASFTKANLALFSLPDDGPQGWDVDAEHLDAPVPDQEEPTAAETVPAEVSPEADMPEAEAPAAQVTPVPVAQVTTVDKSLLRESAFYLTDASGNRSNIYTFSVDQLANFAQILNDYRAALPQDGSLHFVIPPVSYVANNILQKGSYTGWGSDLEDVLQPVVSEGVYVYDVADILTPYLTTERLYPINDHHWQPFSASAVTEAMIRNQGLPPMNFYEYRYYVSLMGNARPFYGDDLKNLSLPADAVPVMEPVCPVDASKIRNFTERSPDTFIDRSKGGLMSYLGGMQPGPWRYFEGGFHTGRNALMVTDSFGLTLAPFLIPYYDNVLFVDLRESLFSLEASGGTIREYIEAFDIDDIYMISSAYNPSIVEQVQSRLFRYLG